MLGSYDKLIKAYMKCITESDDSAKIIADIQKLVESGLSGIGVIVLAMKDGSVKLVSYGGTLRKSFLPQVVNRGKNLKAIIVDPSKGFNAFASNRVLGTIPLAEIDHVVDPYAQPKRISTPEEMEEEFGKLSLVIFRTESKSRYYSDDEDAPLVVTDHMILTLPGNPEEKPYCQLENIGGVMRFYPGFFNEKLEKMISEIVGEDVPLKSEDDVQKVMNEKEAAIEYEEDKKRAQTAYPFFYEIMKDFFDNRAKYRDPKVKAPFLADIPSIEEIKQPDFDEEAKEELKGILHKFTANAGGARVESIIHAFMKDAHPEEHKSDRFDNYRGYHGTNCSCGYGMAVYSDD